MITLHEVIHVCFPFLYGLFKLNVSLCLDAACSKQKRFLLFSLFYLMFIRELFNWKNIFSSYRFPAASSFSFHGLRVDEFFIDHLMGFIDCFVDLTKAFPGWPFWYLHEVCFLLHIFIQLQRFYRSKQLIKILLSNSKTI